MRRTTATNLERQGIFSPHQWVPDSEDLPIPFRIKLHYMGEVIAEVVLNTDSSDQDVHTLVETWARQHQIPNRDKLIVLDQIVGERNVRRSWLT